MSGRLWGWLYGTSPAFVEACDRLHPRRCPCFPCVSARTRRELDRTRRELDRLQLQILDALTPGIRSAVRAFGTFADELDRLGLRVEYDDRDLLP